MLAEETMSLIAHTLSSSISTLIVDKMVTLSWFFSETFGDAGSIWLSFNLGTIKNGMKNKTLEFLRKEKIVLKSATK